MQEDFKYTGELFQTSAHTTKLYLFSLFRDIFHYTLLDLTMYINEYLLGTAIGYLSQRLSGAKIYNKLPVNKANA